MASRLGPHLLGSELRSRLWLEPARRHLPLHSDDAFLRQRPDPARGECWSGPRNPYPRGDYQRGGQHPDGGRESWSRSGDGRRAVPEPSSSHCRSGNAGEPGTELQAGALGDGRKFPGPVSSTTAEYRSRTTLSPAESADWTCSSPPCEHASADSRSTSRPPGDCGQATDRFRRWFGQTQ